MSAPIYTDVDFANPEAPPGKRRPRPDHPDVQDRSYEQGRMRQRLDLYSGATTNAISLPDPLAPDDDGRRVPRLSLFVKDRPRGVGYVSDFLYTDFGLPFTVYGTLVSDETGLMVSELELWRRDQWEYRDHHDDYIGPDAAGELDEEEASGDDGEPDPYPRFTGISSSSLRQIPVGRILDAASAAFLTREWDDHLIVVAEPDRREAIAQQGLAALDRAAAAVTPVRRGRPALSDDHLAEVARAYLDELAGGRGVTSRVAARFDRPIPTVRDWIAEARRRDLLGPARAGRRGAVAGPRLADIPGQVRVRCP